MSILPTFYEQFLRQNPFAKILQTQIVSTQKLRKKTFVQKAAHKILVKLTPAGRKWQLIHPNDTIGIFQP